MHLLPGVAQAKRAWKCWTRATANFWIFEGPHDICGPNISHWVRCCISIVCHVQVASFVCVFFFGLLCLFVLLPSFAFLILVCYGLLEPCSTAVFLLLFFCFDWLAHSSPVASRNDTFNCYSTSTYKLHYFETATGLRFVLNTDPKCPNLQKDLRRIYGDLFVEYVTKNPMYKVGETVTCSHFLTAIDKFVKRHPNFKTE
jgi:hypothetical protein